MIVKVLLLCFVLLVISAIVQGRTLDHRNQSQFLNLLDDGADAGGKQLFLGAQGKETSTPDFVRLVVMRLIYGIASTMGLEERLEGVFNGVFVPPNADEDIFGFGGADDGDGLDGIFDDI